MHTWSEELKIELHYYITDNRADKDNNLMLLMAGTPLSLTQRSV